MVSGLLILGAIGHGILWVALVNRIHALGIERRWVDLLTLVCGFAVVALPAAVAAALWASAGFDRTQAGDVSLTAAWTYVGLCTALAIAAAMHRFFWTRHPERRGALVARRTAHGVIDGARAELIAPGLPTLLGRLPGNQVLDVRIEEKELWIPRLPGELEGLRIAHLSDLHMSGRLTKSYFEQVVAATNRCAPDFVALTGDLVEREASIDWIAHTMGML